MDEKEDENNIDVDIEEARLSSIETKLDGQQDRLRDLIDYLERKKIIPGWDMMNFTNWESELHDMRVEDMRQQKIKNARQVLEDEGYLVARDANELDSQRLKHWVQTKERNKNDT